MALLPDFGTYLVDHNILAPFTLKVYGDLVLSKDQFLAWAISGSTSQSSFSSLSSNPVPLIDQPYLFTIYLGSGSQFRADKILARLQSDGLSVIPRLDKKYLVPSGREWVVPLQYLKP